jgi:hypothetical protein
VETITITITAATLQAIGMGLREIPYKIAQPAIAEIDEQVKSYLAEKKDGDVGSIHNPMVPGGPAGDHSPSG